MTNSEKSVILTPGKRIAKYLWLGRSQYEEKLSALGKVEAVLRGLRKEGFEPWQPLLPFSDDIRMCSGCVDSNMTFHLEDGTVYYNAHEYWARNNLEHEIKNALVLRGSTSPRWLPMNSLTPEQIVSILKKTTFFNFQYERVFIDEENPFLRFNYISQKEYARFEITPETGNIYLVYGSGLNQLLSLDRLSIIMKRGRKCGVK